ncbi:MAG: tRNA lysidine(34) synthetase TilS [Exilispira sp.]
MKSLEDKVYLFLNNNVVNLSSTSITVALSMGCDSMALFFILLNLKKKYNFILSACHLNHNLREESNTEQQEFIKLMNQLNIRYYTETLSVPIDLKNSNKSFELWARNERLKFFKRAKEILNSQYIAIAHNKDDILETFYLNLFRGSGLSGVASIKPKRDYIIRPVIDITKNELKSYLNDNNIAYFEDKTNADNKIKRNYIRNILIREISEKFPGSQIAVINFIKEINKTIEFIESFTPSWFNDNFWDKNEFLKLNDYLKSFLLYKKIKNICNLNNVDFTSIDISRKKIEDSINKINSINSGYVARFYFFDIYIAYKKIYFVIKKNYVSTYIEIDLNEIRSNNKESEKYYILSDEIKCEYKRMSNLDSIKNKDQLKNIFLIKDDKNIEKIIISKWQKGDKINLKNGEKKLHDIFIDWKIPRPFRENILVIRSEKDLIGFYIPYKFGNRSNYILSKNYYVDFESNFNYIVLTIKKNFYY